MTGLGAPVAVLAGRFARAHRVATATQGWPLLRPVVVATAAPRAVAAVGGGRVGGRLTTGWPPDIACSAA